MALLAGTHYHRVGCSLVLGKPDAHPVDTATIEQRGLRACPACRPDPPGGSGAHGLNRDHRRPRPGRARRRCHRRPRRAGPARHLPGHRRVQPGVRGGGRAGGRTAPPCGAGLGPAGRCRRPSPSWPSSVRRIGVAMSVLVFRPLERRRAGTAESLVASLGVFVVLVGVISLVWGTQSWPDAPAPVLGRSDVAPVRPHGATRQRGRARDRRRRRGGLTVLLRTRVGLTARAVVEDRDLAELTAIDTDRVSMLAWAGGSALAGLAGILIAPTLRLDPYGLTLVVLGTMAVAVIARLSSPLIAVARRARDRHRPERAHPMAPRRPGRGAGPGALDQPLRGRPAGRPAGHAQPDRRRQRVDHLASGPPPRSAPADRLVGAGDPRAGRTADVLRRRPARGPDGAGPRRDLPVDRGGHRLHRTDLARPGRLRRSRCPGGGEAGPRRARAAPRASGPDGRPRRRRADRPARLADRPAGDPAPRPVPRPHHVRGRVHHQPLRLRPTCLRLRRAHRPAGPVHHRPGLLRAGVADPRRRPARRTQPSPGSPGTGAARRARRRGRRRRPPASTATVSASGPSR